MTTADYMAICLKPFAPVAEQLAQEDAEILCKHGITINVDCPDCAEATSVTCDCSECTHGKDEDFAYDNMRDRELEDAQ